MLILIYNWGFGGCWMFQTGGLHPDLDLIMVPGL